MKNYFLALCILLLAGCTKADVESVSYQKIDSPQFYAEFAEGDTRTFVDEKVRLLWNEGDLLTIFTTTLNQKYQFDGETGDNSGTFTQTSVPQFGTGNNISANYAVYPYSSSTKISNDEVITLSLPATQQYAEDSFGPNANTMVAVTSGINDYFLPFKNVGGFLRLRLYGEGVTVKSIQLQGNNSEKIAGKATVVAKYGKSPELEMSDDATEIITLDCGDGVELGATASEATDFWIVVPPTTFTKGFTIKIIDTDGGIIEKSTSKNYVVERNVLKSMSAFEVENPYRTGKVSIENLKYDGFDAKIYFPIGVRKKGGSIKWSVMNIARYNMNKMSCESDASMLYLHDGVYPAARFVNDTTLTIDEAHRYAMDADGNLIVDEWMGEPIYYWDFVAPGEPLVLFMSEVAYGESEWGWGKGWYTLPFDSDGFSEAMWTATSPDEVDESLYWEEDAWYKKVEVTTLPPEQFDGTVTIETKNLSPSGGSIVFTPDDKTYCYYIGMYNDTTYNTYIDMYLDGKEEYMQWLSTSCVSAYTIDTQIVYADIDKDGVNDVQEMNLSDFLGQLIPGGTYHVILTAMGSREAQEGEDSDADNLVTDIRAQNYQHITFTLPVN